MSGVAEANDSSKRSAMGASDGPPVKKAAAEPAPSPEVAELRQQLKQSEEKFQKHCDEARRDKEALQAKVDYLEKQNSSLKDELKEAHLRTAFMSEQDEKKRKKFEDVLSELWMQRGRTEAVEEILARQMTAVETKKHQMMDEESDSNLGIATSSLGSQRHEPSEAAATPPPLADEQQPLSVTVTASSPVAAASFSALDALAYEINDNDRQKDKDGDLDHMQDENVNRLKEARKRAEDEQTEKHKEVKKHQKELHKLEKDAADKEKEVSTKRVQWMQINEEMKHLAKKAEQAVKLLAMAKKMEEKYASNIKYLHELEKNAKNKKEEEERKYLEEEGDSQNLNISQDQIDEYFSLERKAECKSDAIDMTLQEEMGENDYDRSWMKKLESMEQDSRIKEDEKAMQEFQCRIAEIKERIESRNTKIAKLEKESTVVNDQVFADFCARIGVADIREYENRDMKFHRKMKAKMIEFDSMLDRIRNELKYQQAFERTSMAGCERQKLNMKALEEQSKATKKEEAKLKKTLEAAEEDLSEIQMKIKAEKVSVEKFEGVLGEIKKKDNAEINQDEPNLKGIVSDGEDSD